MEEQKWKSMLILEMINYLIMVKTFVIVEVGEMVLEFDQKTKLLIFMKTLKRNLT